MFRSRAGALAAAALAAACLSLQAREACAQLNGLNLKGDQGLKAGTQAPPGVYVGAPLYWYSTDTIKTEDGRALSGTEGLDMFLGGPLVSAVTPWKVFGGTLGFTAVLPFANTRIELPTLAANPGPGFSDIYVQPINLGWRTPRADVLAGYGFFIPSGRYTAGAKDNTGLGMWAHELSAGTTVYFDENRLWHAATLAALEFHSGKNDSDARVGTLLTLEGGAGRDFLKGAARLGAAYYAQWKITDDTLHGVPALLVRGRHRVAALGPEVSVPIATKNTLYGFLTARCQWEMGARTTTEGRTINVVAVFPAKPVKIVTP